MIDSADTTLSLYQVRTSTFASYNMPHLGELFENRPGGMHEHDLEELEEYDLEKINWRQFYVSNAHQIRDMLIEVSTFDDSGMLHAGRCNYV